MCIFGIFLFYEFNKGYRAMESARNINALHKDWALRVSQCLRWFQLFQIGN